MAHNNEQFPIQLGERGRIVLPARVREALSLHPGDRLVLTVEKSGEMRLTSLARQIESGMGLFKHIAPKGRRISDELIADRRREAKREERK
jgi:AbrB family looped-hinge helix DNA binding protein